MNPFGVVRIVNTRINWLQRNGTYAPKCASPDVWSTDDRERAFTMARANSGLCAQIENNDTHAPSLTKPTHNNRGDEPTRKMSEEEWEEQANHARATLKDLREELARKFQPQPAA